MLNTASMAERCVDVVIPTCNRAGLLAKMLPSYLADGAVARIIIVDDASSHADAQLLAGLPLLYPGRIVVLRNAKRLGQQGARRVGIAAVTTSWMLFGEDDVWLGEGYISNLLFDALQSGADVIAGRLINWALPKFDGPEALIDNGVDIKPECQFQVRFFSADYSGKFSSPVRAPYLHTIALIAMGVYSRAQFDAQYRGNAHREETDFYLTCNERGLGVYLSPNAVCFHLRCGENRSGGHRDKGVRLMWVEYWTIRNTYRLVSKHWQYLMRELGFDGSPEWYMVRFFIPSRLRNAITRVLRGGSIWRAVSSRNANGS